MTGKDSQTRILQRGWIWLVVANRRIYTWSDYMYWLNLAHHSFTLTMAKRKEYIKDKNWALLDIEYIQCTRTHKCVRKLYMLAKDGYMDLLLEFFPCEPLHKLDKKYQRAFRYCQREIHKLPYCPSPPSPPCWTAVKELNNFIVDNDIELVFYKGGEIETNFVKNLILNH